MKLKYTTLLLSLCAALAACNDVDVFVEETPTDKTPIELSVGGVDAEAPATRAVITEEIPEKMKPFDKNAYIFMVMKSEYDTGNPDFKGGQNTKYTVCRGNVTANQTGVVFDNNNKKYWDDAHARSSMLSIWAYASMCPDNWYDCNFQVPNPAWTSGQSEIQEYKDQPYTTSSAIPWEEQGETGSKGAIYPCIMSWKASHYTQGNNAKFQDVLSVQYQDLLFSNNLANYNTDTQNPDPTKDHRLKFNFSTRKFPTADKAKMNFYHAMSKITIHIKKDANFGDGFAFTGNGNVTLKGFNTEGTFNIKDGEFQKVVTYDIPQIYNHQTKDQGDDFTLEALVVPNIHEFMKKYQQQDLNSRFDKDATNVMMEFTIKNNKYQLTSGQLYNALHTIDNGQITDNAVTNATHKNDNGHYVPLEAGKNYHFTFSIGKTSISSISAQVVNWETVQAAQIIPENAYVRLSLKKQSGGNVTGKPTFDFYLAEDPTSFTGDDYNTWAQYAWDSGYKKESVTWNTSNECYETPVFWPDNSTFYHFRTINRGLGQVDSNGKLTTSSDNIDYVTMYSGPINDAATTVGDATNDYSYTFSTAADDGNFNDYIWGAPFKKTTGTNGDQDNQASTPAIPDYSFDHGYCNNAQAKDGQIYKAIGATKDVIFFYQFHMMSNIYVDLSTPTDGSNVVLTGATVTLKNYTKSAKLQMGDAKIVGNVYDDGTGVNIPLSPRPQDSSDPDYDYSYRVVPQPLKYTPEGGTQKTVGLVITTTDDNVYEIEDLSKLKVKGEGDQPNITEWLPGKKYFYSFQLKKTGIELLKATIVDWKNVEAGNQTITIK